MGWTQTELQKPKIVWNDTLLKLTLDQERNLMTNPRFSTGARRAAYLRLCAKQWYEALVLVPKVKIDLNDLDPQDAAEVVELRNLVGFRNPPWLTKELAA